MEKSIDNYKLLTKFSEKKLREHLRELNSHFNGKAFANLHGKKKLAAILLGKYGDELNEVAVRVAGQNPVLHKDVSEIINTYKTKFIVGCNAW